MPIPDGRALAPAGRPKPLPRALSIVPTAFEMLQGVDLDQLLDMSTDELVELFPARQRRR